MIIVEELINFIIVITISIFFHSFYFILQFIFDLYIERGGG